ncbi:MAG: hypothetical protein DMD78_04490 [Candidatus Rokuibacteriota bacterium]|nr:MAG: hypothetical protein DMD78_04490 [Candidatus Rokubacteria bacterium]
MTTTRGALKVALLAACLVLAGCVTLPWYPTSGIYTSEAQNFAVELPKGWMRLNSEENLLITRDGILLQHVTVERARVDRPLKNTKKVLSRGMQPQAVAEVIIDNFMSSERMLDLKVLENRPIQIGPHRGFRLVYAHRDKEGLRFKSVLHGFLAGDVFYSIRYTAAERYYFAKDLATFEQVLASFRLIHPA